MKTKPMKIGGTSFNTERLDWINVKYQTEIFSSNRAHSFLKTNMESNLNI